MIVPVSFSNRALLLLACAVGLIAASGATIVAKAASESPWVSSANSKTRLISGTLDIGGEPTLVAGVQLRMDPGWKTYWRNPGDSGVPPVFNWSGSNNLKAAEVLYPAPHRFPDGAGTAIGYDDEVVFPVKITPERENEPVELKLAFEYGLCKDLCIPNEVSLSLELPAKPHGSGDAFLLATALQRIAKPSAAEALPRVDRIDAELAGAEPRLVIEALFPADAREADLFIAADKMAVPVPTPLGPLADGKRNFEVKFASAKEAEAIKGAPLTLTLVSDRGATEMTWNAE